MTKKTKQDILIQANVMAGVIGHPVLTPIVLRILVHGYLLGCGHSVVKAAKKAEALALEIEASHDSK
jgi:hypothetical protein